MPSVISHAVVAVAAGVAFAPRDVPNHFWPLSIVCSTIADADVIAFSFGIPYQHLFGHRGFFHPPFFGLLMSIFFVCFFFRDAEIFSRQWCFYFIFFFLLSASHGILDALTNGGMEENQERCLKCGNQGGLQGVAVTIGTKTFHLFYHCAKCGDVNLKELLKMIRAYERKNNRI